MKMKQECLEVKTIRGTTLKSVLKKHGLTLRVEEQKYAPTLKGLFRAEIKGVMVSRVKHYQPREMSAPGETVEDAVGWLTKMLYGAYIYLPNGKCIGPLKLTGHGF